MEQPPISYSYSTPPPQPCPVCGAGPEMRAWSEMITDSYTRLRSKKHSIVGTKVVPLVCCQCGYVQFFTNPQDFRD